MIVSIVYALVCIASGWCMGVGLGMGILVRKWFVLSLAGILTVAVSWVAPWFLVGVVPGMLLTWHKKTADDVRRTTAEVIAEHMDDLH